MTTKLNSTIQPGEPVVNRVIMITPLFPATAAVR
jgi:hypothetical protein